MANRNIAGMSMKGGRNDKFFCCVLEFFPNEKRWFLRNLLQVKDEEGLGGDEAIRSWIKKYDLHQMVVDFPLSNPACQTCVIDCPGISKCPVGSTKAVTKRIIKLLAEDAEIHKNHPKEYERNRVNDDLYDYSKDILESETHAHILSKPFKRKLKKGYLPYWNRPVDFWVWHYYYDQLLEIFNSSYDSFGNTSLMVQSRFAYLRRHFPTQLELFESNTQLVFIELLRAGIVAKQEINNLNDMESGIDHRLTVIKKIEKHLNLFIYDNDLELIVKNPRAFDSFILAVAGQAIHLNMNRELPDWTEPSQHKFTVPSFS